MELYLLVVDSVEQVLEISNARVAATEVGKHTVIIVAWWSCHPVDILNVREYESLTVLFAGEHRPEDVLFPQR